MKEYIANELKLIRIKKNIKLNDAADLLHINSETLRRYEKNSNGLSVERLEEILKIYNVKSDIFFSNVCENMHES